MGRLGTVEQPCHHHVESLARLAQSRVVLSACSAGLPLQPSRDAKPCSAIARSTMWRSLARDVWAPCVGFAASLYHTMLRRRSTIAPSCENTSLATTTAAHAIEASHLRITRPCMYHAIWIAGQACSFISRLPVGCQEVPTLFATRAGGNPSAGSQAHRVGRWINRFVAVVHDT